MRPLVILLLLGIALAARADVFTLLPGSDRGTVRDALRTKKVMTEPMTINGQRGTLEVALSDLAGNDLSQALRTLLKDYRGDQRAGTIVLESPARDGVITRHLIVRAGNGEKTVVFTMDVPAAAPAEDQRGHWPSTLPVPIGARVESVMALNDRSTVYAMFNAPNRAAQALAGYDLALRSQNWRLVASDGTCSSTYLSGDGKRFLLVSTSEHDQGSRGAVYLHELR